MGLLKRKIDAFLLEWKRDKNRLPLIVKGARQVGKTSSIRNFGKKKYKCFIEINFILQKKFSGIFDDGYDVDSIIKNISFVDPNLSFVERDTLIFFDEMQANVGCATALKSFKEDGRFDVICSGSLMGINYNEIESVSVGYKQDKTMYSMDFEEFLWAKGYPEEIASEMLNHMLANEPFSQPAFFTLNGHFRDYLVLGGMPAIVDSFIRNKNFSGVLDMQRQILTDYEEDITKYAGGLDKAKILNVYRKIPVFLGKDNKKFRITNVAQGARSREYSGTVDWLYNAGIVHICYCMTAPELPLRGNYDPDNFKLYFGDMGLLIGALEDEAQDDLRYNKNFNTYKGAIFENLIADTLVKQDYDLYFYRNSAGTTEIDFLIRDRDSVVPIEVKARNSVSESLKKMIATDNYPDVKFGIKLADANIGKNDGFYTFPHFAAFLLKRFLQNRK